MTKLEKFVWLTALVPAAAVLFSVSFYVVVSVYYDVKNLGSKPVSCAKQPAFGPNPGYPELKRQNKI